MDIDILQKVKGDIHFVLFGDGSQNEILRRYRDQMWQRERVHFVSPWKMSNHLLQQLDCMLTPADHDGQAVGMRIAQALGVPNVAARSDGNAELIHSGETGLLAGTDAGSLAKQIFFVLKFLFQISKKSKFREKNLKNQKFRNFDFQGFF